MQKYINCNVNWIEVNTFLHKGLLLSSSIKPKINYKFCFNLRIKVYCAKIGSCLIFTKIIDFPQFQINYDIFGKFPFCSSN